MSTQFTVYVHKKVSGWFWTLLLAIVMIGACYWYYMVSTETRNHIAAVERAYIQRMAETQMTLDVVTTKLQLMEVRYANLLDIMSAHLLEQRNGIRNPKHEFRRAPGYNNVENATMCQLNDEGGFQ